MATALDQALRHYQKQHKKLSLQMKPGCTYKLVNPSFPNSYYIVHPSAKENNCVQMTHFYKDSPTADILRTSIKEIAKELVIQGYTTIQASILV